jgi:hypothetical protein
MNKSTITFLFLFSLLLFSADIKAQQDTIKLVSIKNNAETVEFCFSSQKGFIVGSERYVLHIGNSYFARSRHPEGNENLICFVFDSDGFSALKDGEEMVLVYGLYKSNIIASQNSSGERKFEGRHWKTGVLNKDLLNK